MLREKKESKKTSDKTSEGGVRGAVRTREKKPMKILSWAFLFLLLFCTPASAADNAKHPSIYKTAFGVLVHDRGPTSDRHEDGIDPNWEVQFNPPKNRFWDKIGSPYPTVGVTPNFAGDTSALYTALTYQLNRPGKNKKMFLAGSVGVAFHDGPLHKDKTGCLERSDCGFGYHILPHFSGEIGYKISGNYAVSLFYDHMSHKYILPGENEGIDHLGLRVHYFFKNHT